MAGRKPPSMQGGWLVRVEGRRILPIMEMDLGLGEEAEVVVVVGIGAAEGEVEVLVSGALVLGRRDVTCQACWLAPSRTV